MTPDSLYLSEQADTSTEEAAMFANISTKTLFEMNTTYTREWLADKDHAGKRTLVLQSGAELTARGAW